MTNSYMTDPASNRKFLFARSTWAKSVSLAGTAAAPVRTGIARLLFVAVLFVLGTASSFATTCPSATALTAGSLPIVNQAIVCGGTNDITSASLPTAYTGSCVNANYYGGLEALYFITPSTTGLYTISISGQTYTGIFVFNGCPTTSGSTCVGGVADATSAKSITVYLTAGTQYFIMFDTWPTPNSPCPGTFSMAYIAPSSITAVAQGGLWNAATTWVGGAVPNAGATVTIPAGATVTVDANVAISNLIVNGTLQHNATAGNGLTIYGDMTIAAGGKHYYHTSAGAAMTNNLAIGGTLTNNGYANYVLRGITFNGGPTTSNNCTLTGSGTFEGGILQSLLFSSTGSHTISQTANLTTGSFAHTAGSLTTNGKVTIDNTSVSQGGSFNTSLQVAAITGMGSLLSAQPVIFGGTVIPYASGAAATLNSLYYAGTNVYRCTVAGTFNATPPSSTGTSTFTTSGPTLLWVGTLGTVGSPWQQAAVTAGTQYFYGDYIYTCITAGTIATGAAAVGPNTTTVGTTFTSGTATFLCAGTAAKVSGNWDATNQMVRSLTIVTAGSGYNQALTNPTCTFSIGATGATGTLPTAQVLIPGAISGGVIAGTMQKSGQATITGAIPINSDGGASALSADPQSSAGVNAIFASNYGVNYTVAPLVGFSPPLALNLVTNAGSGYTAAPTITLTGGTLVAGTALTSANFLITVNQGKVVSVYCNATTAQYSVLPTLTMSAPTAGTTCTLAWPANCLPTATATINSSRQLQFTLTNGGYGYVAAPTVAVGTVAGTTGTFTTAASGLTARLGNYTLTLNFFTPATAAVAQTDVSNVIPSNRKMLALNLNGNGAGLTLTSNLTLYGSTPLALVASGNAPGNKLDMGGNNVLFTWNGYGGLASTYNVGGTKAYVTNGSMTLTTRGGGLTGSTLNYPFAGNVSTPLQVITGTGTSQANGADILTVKVTENLSSPTNSTGTGLAFGNRTFTVNTATYGGVAGTAGTNPTVRMAYNSDTDPLVQTTALQNATFVAEGAASSGPWNLRSAAFGATAVAMPAVGTLTTATVAPGPITLANGNRYSWAAAAPSITSTSIDGTSVCANSAVFTITGTGFSGVTAVAIGGVAVSSFTVNSDTQITATAGNAATGVVSVTKLGGTSSGAATITVNASPAAPSLSASSVSDTFGSTTAITASGVGSTFNWYNVATGGVSVASGATYNVPACATGSNFWVAENDGTCEGARAQVSVTVSPAIAATASPAFICANNTPVTLTTNVADATYAWTASQGSLSSATASSPTLNSLTYTAEVNATISKNGCNASVPQISVGVYSFPAGISPTATPNALCSGTSTTLATGLSAGNFTAVCATPRLTLSTPGAGARNLILNGVTQTPLPSGVTNPASSLDDGYFAGIPIGFNFNFFGNTATSVFVGTNGTIVMNVPGAAGSSAYTFTGGFPNAANPASTVAVCARDLRFGTPAGQGTLTYWTEGTAPNRRFIVQYNNVPTYSGGGVQNAEAVFYETLGQIDIRIISATDGTASYSKYIGLQDASRTIGATAPNCSSPFQQNYWNGITNVITSPLAWSFIPPKNYTYNWTNTANTTVGNAGTGQLSGTGSGLASPITVSTTSTSQTPDDNITYQVYIQDPISGCSNVYNVPVAVTQTPAAPTTSFGSATPYVMCGTQVPNSGAAMVSCPTCGPSVSFNWYNAATGGSLFQGSISENFNSGINPGTFTLVGNAALQNTRCELTQATTSQYGALLLGSTGVNTNAYEIDFDLRVDQSDGTGGADGMSYSFGNTVVATQEATMNAENGTGNKLKVAFVTYTNGTSPAGIYLMYNCTTNEQTTTTPGVLAYSSDVSWKNTTSDVHVDISINSSGQVTLLLNGVAPTASNGTFTNAQLPLAYLAENKATWQHVFKARTGAAYSRCSIDNMIVNSMPLQSFPGIVQAVSTSTSYYVQSIVGICGSATRTEVALQVAPPPAFAVTTGITACPYTYTPVTVTTGIADYTQFIWSPVGLGLLFNDAAGTQPYTGDSRATVYVYAATPGAVLPAIVCDALDGNGPVGNQCANTASSILTVGSVPAAPVITASSTSVCSNSTITLSAAASVTYTTPTVSLPTSDEDISVVRIGQGVTTVFNNTSSVNSLVGSIGTATGTAGGYANYSAFGPYTLNAAQPVSYQLSSTNTGFAYPNSLAIYIDYNQDGDFADAGENAYNQNATVSGPQTVTGTFTIPAGALSGVTRMRVVCNEGLITSPTQSVSYGEWEDYAINIVGGVSYTYAWTGGISATTQTVTSPGITGPVNFSATVSQGGCYSAPSNTIAVAVASAPTITPVASVVSGGYTTPSVSSPTFDEDVSLVRLQVDFDGDGTFNTANGDYNVFTNTSTVNSLVGSIGTASGTAGGYSNYTAFGPYTLDATYQHRLVIGSTDQGGGYTQALAAWIDFNQDGDFIDAGEQIILGAAIAGPHNRNAFFTVPATAKNGVTRMRVMVNEGAITGPTMSVSWGEFEDYALNVINAVTAVPCPGSSFSLNAQVVGGGQPYASYAWTVASGTATLSSASAASPSATVTGDATFSLTLVDGCGVSVSGTTATVDVLENTIAVTPVNPTVCGNPGTSFTATGGSNYTWTPNDASAALNTSTGATVIASPSSTKTYTVSGLYGAGCVGTATTTLNYTAPPAITITNEGPDQDINCGYGPVYQSTLHATSSASYTYTWSNGSGNNAADVFTPGANGFLDAADDSSFVVTLTAQEVGGAGCYSVSQRPVSVFGLPTPTMTATPSTIVLGATSALTSGVTQGNFSVTPCGPTQPSYNRITPPPTATTLVSGGVAVTPQTTVSLDDGGWGNIPIGFSYNFFGNNYTSLNVGTNGVVQFGAYNGAALQDFTYANPFPTALEPTNIIALCAVDLYLSTSGDIKYWVDGIAPNRKFILDFYQVPGFITNGLQTVQLQLSETTGIFEIHLGQATSTSAKTIGVNNATGTIGAVAQRCEGGTWNSQTGTSTTPKAWRFNPPVDYTFAWSPAGEISGPTNTGSATALPTAAGIRGYELLITDNTSGCSNAANPDSVYVTVLSVPATPDVVGFGEASLTDGTNTVPFCGEQDVQAYVPSAGYPASQYGQALTWSVNWYLQATGGTPAVTTALQDTIVYGFLNSPVGLTSDDTLYVAVNNGFGESARRALVLDYQTPPAVNISNSSPVNCGPASLSYQSTLTASSSNAGYAYTWGPSSNLDVTTGSSVVVTLNNTVNVTLNADDGYCHADIVTPVSRYDFPQVVPTAANDSVCPGGTTTLNSNTTSTGFTIASAGYSPTAQSNATTLVQNALATVPLTTGGLDDGLWQNIPIGFNFDFLGNTYTSCAISTNGNLQFGPTFSTSYTPTFGATAPNNFVALFWCDMNFGNADGNSIRYWTSGVTPNRIFSVRFDGSRFAQAGSSRLTGQIDLYETTGIVRTHIQAVSGSGVTIVGAEDLTGTVGSAVPTRNGAGWTVTTPEAWQFNPPVNYSYAWSPSGQIQGSTTGATATAAPTANTTYQLVVTDLNTGCDNSINQQAFVTVNVASAAPVTNFIADDLTPSTGGVMQTVNFTTTTPELGPTTYAWTFTPNTVTYVNGTSATSRDPQVQFEEPGQYTCELTMTTCTGTTTKTRTNYISAYAEYCQPIFGTNSGFDGCQTGYGLGNVTIFNPDGVTVMNHTNTGCNNSATAYVNYGPPAATPVNGVTTCTMYQGTTYSITTTSLSPTSNMFFAAYLDVDNDGDFNDPLEFLGFNSTAASTSNFSIGIPTANVSYGLHKMRVIAAFGTGALNANSSCIVTNFGEAHDYVVNIQPPVLLNDIPAFASLVQYSVNQNYPNCYPLSGTTTGATNSPETSQITGGDVWYRFVAQSTAVSITLTSTAFDDAIALYSRDAAGNYNLVGGTGMGYENASSGAGDFERLNASGLTPGTTYYIAVGSNSGTGSFQLCVQHLMKSWCAYTIPAGGFSLCDAFKAVYRGAPSQGVTYAFTFAPTGSTAGTATTLSGTNGLITLSNPTLALRYAGTYNAKVDVTYTLTNSAGTAEPIVVSGATTDPNCTGTNIAQHVMMEVRSTQRCPATLLRTNSLIGASVPGSPSSAVCAATSYTYEFTRVTSCTDGTVQGLATTYNTAAGTPYLGLGVLANLPNTGAWDVRIRPNFSYGPGTFGPTQRIQVNNTAASGMLDESGLENGEERSAILTDANLYPNPNSGEMVNINITGIQGNDVYVRVLDATGRVVYTNRYAVEGSLNTVVNFAQPLASGVYNVEFTVDGQVTTERMIVAKQ